MNVCFIAPTDFLESIGRYSKTHLVLAHIYIADAEYRKFYQERVKAGDFVMLDNSAYELGSSVAVQLLRKVALELKPSAIFLPDVRFESNETLSRVREGIKCLQDLKNYKGEPVKLFAVPQGKNLEDVLYCYDELMTLGIDGFGLYEEIGEVTGLGRRWDFLKHLDSSARVQKNKYYHMLGMEEDIQNISKLSKFDWVNSVDSVKPIAYGLYGIAFSPKLGPLVPYPHRQKGYFEIKKEGSPFFSIVSRNCKCARAWGRGEYHKF